MSFDVNARLSALIDLLDIPEDHYEKAVGRYESLSEWFKREASSIAKYNPLVYPQGSFRYGTVIRPLTPNEEYDLDVVCHLLLITKTDLTQQQLKALVGAEVKAYAAAMGIKAPVVERKRAWRLDYADGVSFHIDIIPCVPEDPATIQKIVPRGVSLQLAGSAIALTCKSHRSFQII
jgi:hypothetical protein